MDTFWASSFGTVMTAWCAGILRAPSWHRFPSLASGWSLAWGRQTITPSLWLSGAARVKHLSRSYAFLGGPLSTARYRLWAQVIRCGASVIPLGEGSTIAVDAHTAKQSGRHLAGRQRYRHGAGSARQAARVLAGLNVVVPSMRLPLALWPEPHLSLPMGLERSLQAPLAPTLGLP